MTPARSYRTEGERWRAVRERDKRADGAFYYVVRTTGVYSRPSCAARHPRRKNILFLDDIEQAREGGYRPCRRCHPDEPDITERHAELVARACQVISESPTPPSLEQLARMTGFSRFHFHRVFKASVGVTPHEYLAAARATRVRRELARADTVTDAIYSSGFRSNGHFYAASRDILGMTPTAFRSGGRGVSIHHATGRSSHGPILVAVADQGVCAELLGREPEQLRDELRRLFPNADLVEADPGLRRQLAEAIAVAERTPSDNRSLPEDVRRLAFKHQVHMALRGVSTADGNCRGA